MSSRTSTSIGMGVTVTLLSVLLLAAFVLAIVFYGQKQRAERDLVAEQQRIRDVIAGEDKTDRVQALVALAKPERKTVVGYLDDSLQKAMRRVTGSDRDTVADLEAKLAKIDGAETSSLLRLVEQRQAEIARLNRSLADAQAALENAQAARRSEVERLAAVEQGHQDAQAALQAELDRYKGLVDENRSQVETTLSGNNARVDEIRASSAQLESSLRAQINELQEKVRLQQETIESLRVAQAEDVLRPTEEYALVDARIISTDGAARQAVIDIGRRNRVVLGMTFAAYSDAAAIKPDSSGAYPDGKATLEVIRIDDASSVCRIVTERRGNPVVVGDVAANAVYDPNKSYTFVVFGNFDADRDGVATPQERNGIVGVVSGWGGTVDQDITGRTDFLVLGDRPVLPPQPPSDAPIQVIQEYIRKQRDAQEYDRLFQTAIQTGIPILNENRLYTLTGISGSR